VELAELLQETWGDVERGVLKWRDPFHLPVLSLVGAAGVDARVVTLRLADRGQRRLQCHVDARSPKAEQARAGGPCVWVFYSAASGCMVRMYGAVELLSDGAEVEAAWARTKPLARRCYLAAAGPGTVLTVPGPGYPLELMDREPTMEESETGRVNFALLRATIDRMDRLDTRVSGHRRAGWTWTGADWEGQWLVP
jgi:hypothetical protein